MYCRKCGKRLNDTDKFCSTCGTRVESQTVSFGTANVSAATKKKREPRLDFTAPVMSWDVDDYPGAKKKTDTGEIDFNWDTIVKNRGGDEGPEEPDTIMTEEELFVKLTQDAGPVSGSTAAMWDLGSTARFEKPVSGKEDRFKDFVAPFRNPSPEFLEEDLEFTEEEFEFSAGSAEGLYEEEPEFEGYDGGPTFVNYDDSPYVEPAYIPQPGTIRPYAAPEDVLVAEMNEGIAASEANRRSSNKFYTFNRKSEEFKALLDQEYERLKARLEENKEEEETLAEKRAKLRAKAAAMEEKKAREEALAAAKAEEEALRAAEAEAAKKLAEEDEKKTEKKEVHWAGIPEFKYDGTLTPKEDEEEKEDRERREREAEEAVDELLRTSEPKLIFDEEPMPWPELRYDEESYEDDEDASVDAAEDETEAEPTEEKPVEAVEPVEPVNVVLTKPTRVWTVIPEEKEPRASVAIPGVFGMEGLDEEEMEEPLEGQEEIDFSTIGELPPVVEIEEENTAVEEVDFNPEDADMTVSDMEAAEEEVIAAEVIETPEEKIVEDIEVENIEEKATDEIADEAEETAIEEITEDIEEASESFSEIEQADKELAELEAKLKQIEAGTVDTATATAELTGEGEMPEGIAIEAAEEVKTGEAGEEEDRQGVRFKDIFAGEDEEAEKKSSGRGKIIALDILIFILTVLVILSAILVFFEGSPLANRIQGGVDKIISLFAGNAAEDSEAVEETQGLSTIQKAISNNSDKNKNIGSVAEDTALLYKEDTGYNVTGIGDSTPFTDSQWYTDDSGNAINYSDEIVGTVISYYSELVDKINSGDNEVLNHIDRSSQLYGTISAINAEGSKEYGIDTLQIGSIRSADKDYYVLIRLSEVDDGEGTPEISSKVVHMVAANKEMLISEIADVK